MNILITGATGFVGKKLTLELFKKGYNLIIATRDIEKAKKTIPLPLEFRLLDENYEIDFKEEDDIDSIIHLGGKTINSKWTAQNKNIFYLSRVKTLDNLYSKLSNFKTPPKSLISAAAIGIYPESENDLTEEHKEFSQTFMGQLCQNWEKATEQFTNLKMRAVSIRTGIVLGHKGGMLDEILPIFRIGAGGNLGSGNQVMSWIHIDDLVNSYIFCLENDSINGAVNGTAPTPVTNKVFTKTMGKCLNKPTILPAPKIGLMVALGKEKAELFMSSQKVIPKKLLSADFKFKFENIELALKDLLSPSDVPGAERFEFYQWIPQDKEHAFKFFSKAENLEKLTPPLLNFKITNKSDEVLKKDTLIDYQLKIRGVPAKWKTLISEWNPNDSFEDTQLKGPYKTWIHLHTFEEVNNGTLLSDRIDYVVPFWVIGEALKKLIIDKDIKSIFSFRQSVIEKSI